MLNETSMLKVAIVSGPLYRSHRVLAECLHMLIKTTDVSSEIFYSINAIKRLLSHKEVKNRYKLHHWLGYKLLHILEDHMFLKKLKGFDAIIICDYIPSAFFKDYFGIERLRKIIGNIPILFYEVFYLGNAPTQIARLKCLNAMAVERYDLHLSVSEVTEIR